MVGLVALCVVVVGVILAAQKKFKKPVSSRPKQTKKQVKRKK
jgi:glucose uptake protein GlcU